MRSVLSRINRLAGNRHTLYLPSKLVEDSTFPFKAGDRVAVTVVNGRLVVEKVN